MRSDGLTRRGAASPTGSLRYSILIQWSDARSCYLATLPEWRGRCSAPAAAGSTYHEALANAEQALERLVGETCASGEEMPLPQVFAESDAEDPPAGQA
jgi:predicted RNase H-like HicB family nuclease